MQNILFCYYYPGGGGAVVYWIEPLTLIKGLRVRFPVNVWHFLSFSPGGGGGGTQIWFRRRCAAEAAKPVPIVKGHFGGKGYPILGFFIQENDV